MARRRSPNESKPPLLPFEGDQSRSVPHPTSLEAAFEALHEKGWLHRKDFPAAKQALETLAAKHPPAAKLAEYAAAGGIHFAEWKKRGLVPTAHRHGVEFEHERVARDELVANARKFQALMRTAHFQNYKGLRIAKSEPLQALQSAVVGYLKGRAPQTVWDWVRKDFDEFAWQARIPPTPLNRDSSMAMAESVGRNHTPLSPAKLHAAVLSFVDSKSRSGNQRFLLRSWVNHARPKFKPRE